jgi:glyoxylase-like metal-dependent hydrolase (beta-lactamase superfamily II)
MTRRPQRSPSRRRNAQPAAAAADAQVRIRHYCQGIGDCHLLRFPKAGGGFFWILIDCGVHTMVTGGSALMRQIVDNIAAITRHIDILVVTHEHWDHVSGFMSAAKQFEQITVGAVWMSWAENAEDPLARDLDQFRGAAMSALQDVSRQVEKLHGLNRQAEELRDRLPALLGFQFGAEGERVRAARDAAAAMVKPARPTYLGPDTPPITIPEVPNLRVYVLGPPRDKAALGVEVRASEMYGVLGKQGWLLSGALRNALSDDGGAHGDPGAPFDASVGTALSDALSGQANGSISAFIRRHYAGIADAQDDQASWRRIDADWLAAGADLALRMDRGINNTSLVLAFELVDSGRVLLFPGDAQAGNWISWRDVEWTLDGNKVKANDLLARTVYLKVAHHGSHNATLKQNGLELMVNPDLTAFIPTSKKDAVKAGWGEMPFHEIVDALKQRTTGRTICADDPWIRDAAARPDFATPSGAIRDMRWGDGIWVELDIA